MLQVGAKAAVEPLEDKLGDNGRQGRGHPIAVAKELPDCWDRASPSPIGQSGT